MKSATKSVSDQGHAPTAARTKAATIENHGPEAITQREMANAVNSSPQMVTQQQVANAIHQSPQIAGLRALSGLQSGGASPIQRVVQSRVLELKGGGFTTKYYSTYHTARTFDDAAAASTYDSALRPLAGFDPYARRPTNHSYHITDSSNVVEFGKQGPHTLSHVATAYRLDEAMKSRNGNDVFVEQVLTPDKFANALDGEKKWSSVKESRKRRIVTDYELLYEKFVNLTDTEKSGELGHEIIMRLMQMDPYTTYGGTSKKSLKGKNERKDDPFDEAFDNGGKFTSQDGFDSFRKRRKLLFPP